ncbi:MAG: hypothetical protein ABIS69_11845, partial [Sediminibacterium sp.]
MKVILSRSYRRTLITGANGMTATQDLSSISFFKPNGCYYIPDSTQSSISSPPTVVAVADTVKKKN